MNAFWVEDEEFALTVQQAWNADDRQNLSLSQKLSDVKKALEKWSKKAHKEILLLKKKLHELMNSPTLSYSRESEKNLKWEIEKRWRQEEMFWRLRSKIKWMK